MSILHRIEDYEDREQPYGKFVDLSFKTESKGYWQCRATSYGITEFDNEPPLQMLPVSEQNQIYEICLITYCFTHGEAPKDLSAYET